MSTAAPDLTRGWSGQWITGTRSKHPDMFGLHEDCAQGILHMQQHFPFNVYLGFSLWRKMIELQCEVIHQGVTPYPSLRSGDTELTGCGKEPKPSEIYCGSRGQLNKVHLFVPKIFLQCRYPATKKAIRSELAPRFSKETSDMDEQNSEHNLHNFLSFATLAGQLDVVNILITSLSLRVDSEDYEDILFHTCRNIRMMEFLISRGASLHATDAMGNLIIHWAFADFGYPPDEEAILQTVKLLVENDVSIEALNAQEQTALHCAAESENLLGLEYLLSQKQRVIQDSESINEASDFSVAQYVNLRNCRGQTALHLAAKKENESGRAARIIRALLANGAEVAARTSSGSNAVYGVRSVEIFKLLLERGLDVNLGDGDEGMTPLQELATNADFGDPETGTQVLRAMLDHGADPLATTIYESRTALQVLVGRAWCTESLDAVKLLVGGMKKCEGEVDSINLRDTDRKTALDILLQEEESMALDSDEVKTSQTKIKEYLKGQGGRSGFE